MVRFWGDKVWGCDCALEDGFGKSAISGLVLGFAYLQDDFEIYQS